MKLLFISFVIVLAFELNAIHAQECISQDDPHMSTFDKVNYEFQYKGDHFILYDDFKETRVTASYQQCSTAPRATCNCAIYLKKGRSVIFMDFCDVPKSEKILPVNQFYHSSVSFNRTGLNAIEPIYDCPLLHPKFENDDQEWSRLPIFRNNYKCAKLVGDNNFETYLFRTVEKECNDYTQIKVMVGNKVMPQIKIKPSKSSFNRTGGLCGLWDNSQAKELYVMDKDGSDLFLTNWDTNKAREFWRLGSRYNKDNNVQKRCPECYLMAEKGFYCPCDDFNLFDDSNYHLNKTRETYCRISNPECIRQKYFPGLPKPPTTTTAPNVTTVPTITTVAPDFPDIPFDEAFKLCKEGILNNSAIAIMSQKEIISKPTIDETIHICALDLNNTGDKTFIDLHKNVLIDNGLIQILGDNYNSTNLTAIETLLGILCPDNCGDKGFCKVDLGCFNMGDKTCTTPVKCQCKEPWGGKDCSQDLSKPVEFELDRKCCDVRSERCDEFNIFASPISARDKVFVTAQITEEFTDGTSNVIKQTVEGAVRTINSIFAKFNFVESTTLFKNLQNETDKKLKSSPTLVNIFVSHSNNNSIQFKSFSLYDSKCRTCTNGNLSLNSGKCDIEGKCWNDKEVSSENKDLVCDPSESGLEWTDLTCSSKTHFWTQWANIDKPDGDGDLELFTLLNKTECAAPKKVEVQTVHGLRLVQAQKIGQVFHLNDSCFGFLCLNKEQKNGAQCYDYRFKHCCPK